MIEKPKQYYDTRRHQLYYQWRESEYFSHQEPIYDRTREYIELLEADNAKLRSICAEVAGILFNLDVDYCGLCDRDSINHPCPVHTVKGGECLIESKLRELGVVE